jgi:ABC-type transport system involved in multi-copper enzyme maturation permease subunit
MLIQAMFLLLVLKVAPYNDDLDDWSSFVCSLALTFTTFAGFLLMIEANSTQQPVLSVGVLTTFLITINAACFAYEIVVIMYVAYQDTLAKKATKLLKLKNNNNKNTKEMSTSSTTKVMPAKSNADNAKIKIKQKHEAENQEFEDWGADGDEAMWT